MTIRSKRSNDKIIQTTADDLQMMTQTEYSRTQNIIMILHRRKDMDLNTGSGWQK